MLQFFSGENQEGKAMEIGRLPGESVLAVTYGYLCSDAPTRMKWASIGMARQPKGNQKKRSAVLTERQLEVSQFFTVIRKNVFFNSRLVQPLMVHEFWLGSNIKCKIPEF